MSKAEDLSKQYRDFREQCGIKDPVMLDEIEEAYFEGYHQAEKDNELTWEDIKVIEKLLGFDNIIESPEEFYQEVLKRFKERKEK
jgi:hypothetical protein